MRTDGAIHVKHGDWLSKYSAAMYNDFTHVHEFGRMDKNGLLRPIHKVNLIFAGETVYHIPTYRKTHPMRMGAIEVTVSPLTAEQKKKVVLDTLKHEYDLQGERLEWLDHAAHIAHGTDTAVEIAEVASLIAEGTAAATALQLMAAVLTPIMIGIAILNAADPIKGWQECRRDRLHVDGLGVRRPDSSLSPVVTGELVFVPRQAGPAQGRTSLERHFPCHRS